MLRTAKCKATDSSFKNNVEAMRKNRNTAAIPLQPDPIIPSISRRRKRSASSGSKEGARKDGGEGSSRDDEEVEGGEGTSEESEGAHNQAPTRTLMSFEKVLSRGALHTAGCCRLVIYTETETNPAFDVLCCDPHQFLYVSVNFSR